jgi:hypothetical protein
MQAIPCHWTDEERGNIRILRDERRKTESGGDIGFKKCQW